MYTLGAWLRRKLTACEQKYKEAEASLKECAFDEEVLRDQWQAQIKAQTRPLPRK